MHLYTLGWVEKMYKMSNVIIRHTTARREIDEGYRVVDYFQYTHDRLVLNCS